MTVEDPRSKLRALVQVSGIRSVIAVAWRDLDDPEAGGSELHADEVLRRWADAGLDVMLRTSAVPGRAERVSRHGYRVERRGGRYQVFVQVITAGLRRRYKGYDALVEIWNGMPFFGATWFRARRLVLLHHVHGEMWRLTLPQLLARIGWAIEHVIAPPFYRSSRIATLSTSSADEIEQRLRLRHVAIVNPGISEFFTPGGPKSSAPLAVAVGRLVTVKRFDLLVSAFIKVRQHIPTARLVIVGEGYLRSELEEQIAAAGAQEWIVLQGHIEDDALRELYRQAWVLTSASLREGWGMSITEAAACGTPSVVSDIAGHRDAVVNQKSGLLVDVNELAGSLVAVLSDAVLREQLSSGALARSKELTWDHTALRLFEELLESH